MKMNEETLSKEVAALLQEVDATHRYSMSRIYALYNEIFGKDEKPQACASCLIRKVRELRRWFEALKPTADITTNPAPAVKKTNSRSRKTTKKSE